MKNRSILFAMLVMCFFMYGCDGKGDKPSDVQNLEDNFEINQNDSDFELLSDTTTVFENENTTVQFYVSADDIDIENEDLILYLNDEIVGYFTDGGIEEDAKTNGRMLTCEVDVLGASDTELNYIARTDDKSSDAISISILKKPTSDEIDETITKIQAVDSFINEGVTEEELASNSKTTELSDGWYETVIVPDSEVRLYHEEDANGEYDIPVAYEAHIDGNMLYLTGGLALFASNDIDTDDIYYPQMPMEVLKYDDYSFEIQGSLSREADVINYYCSENGISWQSTKNMIDMIKTGFEGDAVFQCLFIEIKNNVVIDAFVNGL